MVEPLEFVFEVDSSETEDGFRRVSDAEKKTAASTKKLSDRLRDFTVIATGATRLVKSFARGISNLGSNAAEQEQVELKLAVALSRTTTEVEKQLSSLKKFASSRQFGDFADETILQLATAGAELGLTFDQITRAIDATLDRTVAFGRSDEGPLEIMRQLSKFAAGTTDGLDEIGIAVEKDGNRLREFNRVLEEMTTGMAQAIRELPTSTFAALALSIDSVLEKLGSIIASTATFQSILGFVKKIAEEIDAALADPEKFREIVDAIDTAVQATLQALATSAAFSLRMLGRLVRGIDTIIAAAARVADFPLFGGSGEIRKTERELEKVSKRITEIQGGSVQRFEGELSSLSDTAGFLRLKVADLTGSISGDELSLQGSLFAAADALDAWASKSNIFSNQAITSSDVIAGLAAKMNELAAANEAAADGPVPLTEAQVQRLFAINEILESYADGFTAALGQFFQEAFDEEVGISEAWRGLGDKVKNEFIGQFSDAAFAPLKSQFGALAVALRQPFEVVGNIISAILSPVTSIINSVISTLVTQFFTLIGLQEVLAATGLAGVTAVAAGAAPVAAVWGAAATAASIATLGAALAFAAPAQAQIIAGGALAKALSIPAAEGALALPVPGGHLLNVAERGKPELVLPLDDPRTQAVFAGAGSGSVQVSFDGATLAVPDEETASFFAAELGAQFAQQLADSRAESAADFIFGGVG